MAPDGSGERHPHQRRLCRGAELGAERPRRDVHPRRERRPALVCRRRLGRDPPRADPARRLGPGLVAAAQLNLSHRIEAMENDMKNKMTSLVAIAAALSLTAGCAHRRADQIPPEAVGTNANEGADTGEQGSNVGGTAVPGSRADFLQSVPSDRIFFEPRFLFGRQRGRAHARRPGDLADAQRRMPASPSRAMPTSAAPANIISRSAIAAPMRRATISSRAASRRRGCR